MLISGIGWLWFIGLSQNVVVLKKDVGYALSSFLITSSRSNYHFLETTRNCWNTKPGSMPLPGSTVAADEQLKVFALSIFLKEKENTCCPSILWAMFFATDMYSWTLAYFFCHNIIDDVSQKLAAVKGEHDDRFAYIFEISISILQILDSLCWTWQIYKMTFRIMVFIGSIFWVHYRTMLKVLHFLTSACFIIFFLLY